jgi:hypothetical protein
MHPLIQAYFERDLAPEEEAQLLDLLTWSEQDALDFNRLAERDYAALGLGAALAAELAMAGKGGWFAKPLAWVHAVTAKGIATAALCTALAGAVVVGAVRLAPRLLQRDAQSAAVAPKEAEGDGLVISLDLAHPRSLTLSVFDGKGRLVRDLGHFQLASGSHRLSWDGLDAQGRPVQAGRYRVDVAMGASHLSRWLDVR